MEATGPAVEADPIVESTASETAEAAALPVVQTDGALSERWFELLGQLSVTGVVRMLAEHALPLELTADRCRLVLDAEHELLLADAQVARLADALAEVFGQRCDLKITLARLDRETPAARRQRERQERQQAAEQAARKDAVVRQLIDTFGGEIRQVTMLEDLDTPPPDSGTTE